MASVGFEFEGMLDGTNAVPVEVLLPLGVAADHHTGDLVLMQSDGSVDQVGSDPEVGEVTGVIMGEYLAGAITPDVTLGVVALITRHQIWRCSMDAGSTTFVVGYTKDIDVVDCRHVSASDGDGSLILYDKSELDDNGNVLARVVFSNATFSPI